MSRSITASAALTILLAGMSVVGTTRAAAQEPSWAEVKCARYKKAWNDALPRMKAKGLGREFLDRHEAFLASGCTAKADVCPRSAMNAGTASTFPPFACRK
jgi:hypothetical protein